MWPILLGAALIAGYLYISSSSDTGVAAYDGELKVGSVVTVGVLKAGPNGEPTDDWGPTRVRITDVSNEVKKTSIGTGKIAAGTIEQGPHAGKSVLLVALKPSDRPAWPMVRAIDLSLTKQEAKILGVTGAANEFVVANPKYTIDLVGREKNIANAAVIAAEPAGAGYVVAKVVRNPGFEIKAGDRLILWTKDASGAWMEEVTPTVV